MVRLDRQDLASHLVHPDRQGQRDLEDLVDPVHLASQYLVQVSLVDLVDLGYLLGCQVLPEVLVLLLGQQDLEDLEDQQDLICLMVLEDLQDLEDL